MMRHTTITLPGDKAAALLTGALHHLSDPDSSLSRRITHAEQLPLPGIPEEVEGVRMRVVRDYFARLLALEEQMDVYREQMTALWQDVKDRSLPVKTMRSALKIARARHKRDASTAVLEACIQVALSLLPPEEDTAERATARRETVNLRTGEVS